jgi:hypothetical protein
MWILILACSDTPAPVANPTGEEVTDTADDGGGGGSDSDGGADGTDGIEPPLCPADAHTPGSTPADYADYPVFIHGTDRRFLTIQDGIWGAEDGDRVVVCPGTFDENIDFKGKPIVVTSQEGPWVTTINGGGRASVVEMRNWEPPESVLEGFRLTHGQGTEIHGGGVFIEWGSPTIRYNIVSGNTAGIAGGVYVRNGGATVHNNLIIGNAASEGGGGVVCTACVGDFRYNTLVDNTSRQGHVGEYFWGAGDLVGNLLVAQDGERGYAFRVMDWREDQSFDLSYNLLWPADIDWAGSLSADRWEHGDGELRADPLFTDREGGDYTLQAASPAVDAGPPGDLDPDGSPADLGAFGGPDGAWPW